MDICCNPINVPYPYQFKRDPRDAYRMSVNREAADPSMVLYRGKYYLFASMTGAIWVSEDLAHWDSYLLPDTLPIYGYAPDVRVLGEWLVFTASGRGKSCSFYRTKDPVNGPWEEISGTFDYWDPNLFQDEDGRVYFYWGCANTTPIWGIELDAVTLRPIGEKRALIQGDPWKHGYERFGENNSEAPRTEEEIDVCFQKLLAEAGEVPEENREIIRASFANLPYIEGAWMTKHEGRYYLQYACPGAELNVYADGVYTSDQPLGPFRLARNNPYSYKPGGFLPGAGHGSTLKDKIGCFWHTATMRISINHVFERRVGLWPAGFDDQGELYCNQRYGDWPMNLERLRGDPWAEPEWMLLSYGKRVSASSFLPEHMPELAVDENVQTWWRAASNEPGSWLCVDLGKRMTVNAVQVNFADDPDAAVPCPGTLVPTPDMERLIDLNGETTQWLLEISIDGEHWQCITDKRHAQTDLPHDLFVEEAGISARFVRLILWRVPYGVAPAVSGLRIFGKGEGERPVEPEYTVHRENDLDFTVSIARQEEVLGYTVLWGYAPDRLYHSWQVMGQSVESFRIGALVQGEVYYARVDAFNEQGITHGRIVIITQ